jgi:NAD(P)-dependent dehydrogenase (short-subunit alcohol dehydrogenase family)
LPPATRTLASGPCKRAGGRAIALALADAGADVVVTARRAREVAVVAEEVRARGRRALEVPTDLRGDTPRTSPTAVLYLAAPASSWVTGQNLLVGGREGGRTVEDRWRRAVT